MKVHISYKYYFNGSGYYPIVPLYFLTAEKKIRSLALIDSGASISIFRAETANTLGITIESGKKTVLGGVGGRIIGYIHNLKVEVAGVSFTCPIVFSREYLVSFNLLGRDTFFKIFTICFEEKHNRVKLS